MRCSDREPPNVSPALGVLGMAVLNRNDVRDFLATRRAKVRPDQVELGPRAKRRVPALRPTEVGLLAGVSVGYYSRLGRGDLGGASEAVLRAGPAVPLG